MENNQRRDFLKKSILGISGAALLPQALRASALTPTGYTLAPKPHTWKNRP